MKKIIPLVLILFLVGCGTNNSQDNIGNQSTSNQSTSQDVFTVTWKNWNGSVLYVDNDAPYGSLPTYSGQTPTREKDSQFSYTFSGWSPEVHRVFSNQDYTAVFDSEPIIPISFIQFEYTQLELYENETFDLKLETAPSNANNYSVTYFSSNKNVVTISDGVVCAIKQGEAVITAATNNGLIATCNVTIYDPITNYDYDYLIKNQVATIEPYGRSDSSEGLTLVSENTDVIEINSDGTSILAKKPGTAKIYFKNSNNLQCGSSCEVNVINLVKCTSVFILFGRSSLWTEHCNSTGEYSELCEFYYRRGIDSVAWSFGYDHIKKCPNIDVCFTPLIQTKDAGTSIYHNVYISLVKTDALNLTLIEFHSLLSVSPRKKIYYYNETEYGRLVGDIKTDVPFTIFSGGGEYAVIVWSD